MPSDPLPLTFTGKMILDPETVNERGYALVDARDVLAIEQEARTLARAEVLQEAVEAIEELQRESAVTLHKYVYDRVLAALSRLGEEAP